MIDPVAFGRLEQRVVGIEKRQEGFEEILEEIRDELQTWRVKFAMGRGMLTACVVMAIFAGYGIKEAIGALVKLV